MNPTTRTRVSLLVAAFVLFAGGIVYRLIDIQILRADEYGARAGDQHHVEERTLAQRGSILDRRGREIAISVPTQSLYVYPGRVQDPPDAARRIARILGMKADDALDGITAKSHRRRMKQGLDRDDVRALRKAGILDGDPPAFDLERDSKRAYPYDHLAAHVVGFAGTDQVGRSGIEKERHDELQGESELVRARRDALGDGYVEAVERPSKPHHDVVLTLDVTLQHVVERELDRAMRDTGATAAFAILLDPSSGEVLALANRPTPSLNGFGRYRADVKRNRATLDLYDPGSTFKVVTASILLDRGAVRPSNRFFCENGSMRVGDRRFHDHDPFGTLTFREVVENSSNIGMIKASRNLSGPAMLEEIRRFGFGATTGVCAAETPGFLPKRLERGSAVDQASASIGYGVSVTGMQMASAIAAIANGGVRVPPRLVLGKRSPDGAWIAEPEPEGRRVVTADTARTMTSILQGAVEHGTGTGAQVPGYRVAGKTGTARKFYPNRGYSTEDYMASFGGFVPAKDPRLVCLVVIDTPRRGGYYGGQAAAPVFRRIMEDALAYLRVPPDDSRTVLYPAAPQAGDVTPASMPSGGGR